MYKVHLTCPDVKDLIVIFYVYLSRKDNFDFFFAGTIIAKPCYSIVFEKLVKWFFECIEQNVRFVCTWQAVLIRVRLAVLPIHEDKRFPSGLLSPQSYTFYSNPEKSFKAGSLDRKI